MAEAAYSVGLVVEARADATTVQVLVDRCLCAHIDWLDPEMLDGMRAWQGVEPSMPFTEWTRAAELARHNRIQSLGKFDGEPGKPYARRAAITLRLFARLGVPDIIILLADADAQPERREGLDQARRSSTLAEQVVIGVPDPKREAWILAAYVPATDPEHERLAQERQRLGFDPTMHPHELRTGGGKREAKLACANLLDDPDHEHRCLASADLELLRTRGRSIGLTAFLREVEERLVPVLGGRTPR